MTEKKLAELIGLMAQEGRRERRIILPSQQCLRKVLAHFIWNEILDKKTTWKKVKKELEKSGSLRSLKLCRNEMERLWRQRDKEIKKEMQS
jgi:hypothetical protein